MFRLPADGIEENNTFYNDGSYRQNFTTDLPDPAALDRMKATDFLGTPKDDGVYLALLDALGLRPGDAVFDFGCS